MLVGYARVSTVDQSLDVQLDKLHQAGIKKIYKEKAAVPDLVVQSWKISDQPGASRLAVTQTA